MNTMLLAAQAAQGGGMGMIIMMVAILVIFWLFMEIGRASCRERV